VEGPAGQRTLVGATSLGDIESAIQAVE
jgi:hypothetical protein